MARPRDIESRDWLRDAQQSEAGVFLHLEVFTPEDVLSGYSGALCVRDCIRSVTIDLDSDHSDDLDALRKIESHVQKAIRWIERCQAQMTKEAR